MNVSAKKEDERTIYLYSGREREKETRWTGTFGLESGSNDDIGTSNDNDSRSFGNQEKN
jgi:hypothetical protein